jgi:simple sugar transport system ATP-binding protein
VWQLSLGEQQRVEILKALYREAKILILDEPTAVLTPMESEELFRVMRRVASEGTAVVFISHKLPEVLAVATRIVVMRRGTIVATDAKTPAALAQAMVGEVAPAVAPPPARSSDAGEILAIVGVAGNGQAALVESIRAQHPELAAIPEDRTRDGLVAEMTLAENVALTSPRADTQQLIDRYSIRARGPQQLAGELSGGNQQKLILARELAREPRMILASEPTRGLDIEATRFVHEQLRAAAARGASIVLITSDLDEAFALADAIQVIYRGQLSARLTPAEARERVASLMAGLA